jgi:hypothetical protein
MAAPFLLPRIRVAYTVDKHGTVESHTVYHGKRALDKLHTTGVREKYVIEHLCNKYILKLEGYAACGYNHHQTNAEALVWRTLPTDLAPHFVPILKHHITKRGGWSLQPYIEPPHKRPDGALWQEACKVYERGTGCMSDCRADQAFVKDGVVCFHDFGFQAVRTSKCVRKRITIRPR